MKIAFFMQETGAVYGAERATLDLAHALRDGGLDVCFYLMAESRMADGRPALRESAEAAGFAVRTFPVAGRLSIAAAHAMADAFREDECDVLHVIGYKANLHAVLSGVRPRVATVHGWLFRRDLKERFYDAIDRWCLRRCDAVLCLSAYYRDLLHDHGIPGSRLHLVPSGLREIPTRETVPEPAGDSGRITFGMMGRFSDEKNHELFLHAAAKLAETDKRAAFRIAGRGPREQELKDLARSLHLKVDFCGYVAVEDFMPSIDVYVICSHIENLPYSILEAMAWGRPVLATRVGGIPDLVDDGGTGYLITENDAASLEIHMRGMLDDTEELKAMGAAGRDRLEALFCLEKCAAIHQDIYQSLINAS